MNKIVCCGFLASLISCSNQLKTSKTSGHYEGMDKNQAEKIVQNLDPVAVAEHDLTHSVMISADLVMDPHEDEDGYVFGLGRSDIAKAIADTGTKVIIVTSADFDATTSPYLESIREDFGELFDSLSFVAANDLVPTIWARDWGPIQAIDINGQAVLLDFNYYPSRPEGDFVPSLLPEEAINSKRLSVPVYNEGGNFMVNTRGECIMTSRVSEANSVPNTFFQADDDLNPVLDENGDFVIAPRDSVGRKGTLYYNNNTELKVRVDDMYLSDDEIKEYYKRYAGCENVAILPRMPYEGTGHIDMWAKFLSDDTILVNNIDDGQLVGIEEPKELAAAKKIQAFLKERQQDLSTLGYELSMIPMPLPSYDPYEWDGEVYEQYIVRSYTNSLILQRNEDGGIQKTALIPQYVELQTYEGDVPISVPYSDESLLSSYEEDVIKAYQKAGYSPTFLPSDDLISMGGAIHCVTMQTHKPVL